MPTDRAGRRCWKSVARLTFAFASLALIFRAVPVAGVSAVLQAARPKWIVAALLLAATGQLCLAKRFRLLTDAYGLSFRTRELLAINLATRFYGLFVPGGNVTATALRAWKLARRDSDYTGSIAAIALDRVVTTGTMCAIGALFGLLAARAGQEMWVLVMGALAAALFAPFAWLIRSHGHAIESSDAAIGPTRRAGFAQIRRALAGAQAISARRWIGLLAWSLAVHLLGTAEYFALARALGLDLGFVAIGWIRAVMLTAALLPITVAGLGLREGAALLTLPAYGVGEENAVSLALLVFAVSHVVVGLAGGLAELSAAPRRGSSS
jgi:uncharacterized protein (TIRG00374 family)